MSNWQEVNSVLVLHIGFVAKPRDFVVSLSRAGGYMLGTEAVGFE